MDRDVKTVTFRRRTIRDMQDQVAPSKRPYGWPDNSRPLNRDETPDDSDSID